MSLRVDPEVADALGAGRPVVALETSIVAHGLPYPHNLEAARGCEAAIRAAGATPATVAVLDGQLRVGLNASDLDRLAAPGAEIRKLSCRDLGTALADGATGATTVAGTVRVAGIAGIQFVATGGIGGVHRGTPVDESADLFELTRSRVVVVCAGPKTLLDVPATLERLESLGIPLIGYRCDECPAFFTARSGRPVSARADEPDGVARAVAAVWATGGTGIVVAVPPPEELLGAQGFVEQALAELSEAKGQAATPSLLSRIGDLSGGGSVSVNVRLVVNNAAVAAHCAAALADGGTPRRSRSGASVT